MGVSTGKELAVAIIITLTEVLFNELPRGR
jgi:hypothetical protein